MPLRFRSLPIRRKLMVIIVVISATALVLAGIASLAASYASHRAAFARQQSSLAGIIADNSTAVLAFLDREGAAAILETLSAQPSVEAAILYTADGREFARFLRDEAAASAPGIELAGGSGYEFSGGYLHLREVVREGGKDLGTLYLLVDLTQVRDEELRHAAWLLVFTVIACLVAAVLASRLQRSVSEPILELAEMAQSVRRDTSWTLPAEPDETGTDEVGVLVASFHEMLEEIRQREAALRDSEANYRMLTEQASDGIAIIDRRGKILSVNQAACDLLGYTREEALQLLLQSLISPDDLEQEALELDQLATGKAVLAERRFIHKDGTPIWVETNSKMLEDGRIQAILRDVTERKRLEEQLRQSQRLEAVGQLAGGVAHDFNNLLTVIGGLSEQLLAELPSDEYREELEEIQNASSRAAELTRQLLAFSRLQILEPRVLELNDTVVSLERMLTRIIGEDIELTTTLDPALGKARVDPGQVEQVILNLVVNARDAMPRGGRITIETRNVEAGPESAWVDREVPSGSYVMLSVRDTGHGIQRIHLPRIFEPFFTTKERGKGTGLGLSTLYGIVKQSGGHVTVSSARGAGTTFRVYFPRVEAAADSERDRDPHRQTPRGRERILLVEDEEMVRRFTRGVLEKLGYTVLEAIDASEALRLSASLEGPIHLLLTDLVMPGMNGRELARRLSAERPEMKVLLTSGYAADVLDRSGSPDEEIQILAKPFSPTALASRVREVLDESG